MSPFGLLFVVTKILGVLSLLKYLSNSSMFCSPSTSSSSLSYIIVSSCTRILSIVWFLPFGTTSSPNSSLYFLVWSFFNFASWLAAIRLFMTTSYLLCLFLISLASLSNFSRFGFPFVVFSAFFWSALILFSSFSIRFCFLRSSSAFGSNGFELSWSASWTLTASSPDNKLALSEDSSSKLPSNSGGSDP